MYKLGAEYAKLIGKLKIVVYNVHTPEFKLRPNIIIMLMISMQMLKKNHVLPPPRALFLGR